MKNSIRSTLAVFFVCPISLSVIASGSLNDGSELDAHKTSINLNLRYRTEVVSQDNFEEDALASLLKTRVNVDHQINRNLSAQFEFDNVSSIGAQHYDSTQNRMIDYPRIADPEGTDLNQSWLDYTSDDLAIRVGRQRILLADKRIVGAKPWRNNEQTYDGARIQWSPTHALKIDGSYITQVNRVYGPTDGENPARWNGDNLFFETHYQFTKNFITKGFIYNLDIEPQSEFASSKTVNNSSTTVGFSVEGAFAPVNYHAAMALQKSSGSSELDYQANYYSVELGIPLFYSKLRLGLETLGSDNSIGFATPLANGHGYQGWADQFLSTPPEGIRDVWIGIDSTMNKIDLKGILHDFNTVTSSSSSRGLGRELDFLATWHVDKNIAVTAKAAIFESSANVPYADTSKMWLMIEYSL